MAKVSLDLANFRLNFPAYNDVVKYPDDTIQATWNTATVYVKNNTNCCFDSEKLSYLLELMTAHLLYIQDGINNGSPTLGNVTNATIDKVSIGTTTPTSNSQFEYWLNQTPYGQQLLALLNSVCAGGFYIGGNAPRLAYL